MTSTSGELRSTSDTATPEPLVVPVRSLYIYEAPVRAWHWLNALVIAVMVVSGYLIASPPPGGLGEASDSFVFGYIRFTHFTAAYILTVGFLLRVYWALVGNDHAHEMFTLPIFSRLYWRELLSMVKWYLFLRKSLNRYAGHNPLARMSMFFGVFLPMVFMIVTGFALYGEGDQAGSWANSLFSSWVIPLFGQSQAVHSWHHLGMWLIVTFVIVHVYTAIREDIMGRQTVISTMINGYRTIKK